MASKPSVTFALCVETGPRRLEYKAAALLHTMRSNMGQFADAAILAYAPRPGVPVMRWCRDLMEHFAVRLIEEPLNAMHADYALANKPLALAHAEENSTTDYVVFLDSDILVWQPPVQFLLPDGIDIAVVPDTTKTTASAGPGDPFEEYWERLYALTGATARPFVTTTLTNEYVRGTWNSGVIALRRSAGIGVEWRERMLQLLANDFAPPAAMYLRENNLFSALVAAHCDHYRGLTVAYNYPIQNWDTMTNRGVAPEAAVLWHYQPFFDRAFRRFARRIDGARTLGDRLIMTGRLVEDLRMNFRRRLGIDETWLRTLRRRARLGPRTRGLLKRLNAGRRSLSE